MGVPIYNTSNLKSIWLIVAGIALSILLINTALSLFTAAYPNWLPRQFFGVDFIADNRQRARAAIRQLNDGTIRQNETFVLILGLSSASEGISLATLSEDTIDQHFLALTGGGRNMTDTARYARTLLKSSATPDLTVLAINPFHLMDPPPPSEALLENLKRQETIVNLLGFWLAIRGKDIKYAVDAGIDQVRSSTFEMLDARFVSEKDPWREIMRMGLTQVTRDSQWASNVETYGERGYYDGENYNRSVTQPAIFKDIVSSFDDRGSDLVVVLMPEHSRLRARIPDSAMRLLNDSVNNVAEKGRNIQVVDYRSAIPDSGFKDISHMNADGRDQFSRMLGDLVAKRLNSNAGSL